MSIFKIFTSKPNYFLGQSCPIDYKPKKVSDITMVNGIKGFPNEGFPNGNPDNNRMAICNGYEKNGRFWYGKWKYVNPEDEESESTRIIEEKETEIDNKLSSRFRFSDYDFLGENSCSSSPKKPTVVSKIFKGFADDDRRNLRKAICLGDKPVYQSYTNGRGKWLDKGKWKILTRQKEIELQEKEAAEAAAEAATEAAAEAAAEANGNNDN